MKSALVKSFLPAVAVATGITLASTFTPANAYGVSPTNAITLDAKSDIGRQLDPMKWLVPSGTTSDEGQKLPGDLSASASVTVNNLTDSLLDLTIEMTNTTASSLQAAIVSFGLAIDPDATSVSIIKNGNVFDNAYLQTGKQNFPGGFKGIDICVAANGCSGGDIKDGLQSGGNKDTIQLRIDGNFSQGVTIASYPLKFQSAYGSYEVAGVPEPITIVGSGLALGFGALFKREISKKRNKAKVKA